MITVTKSRSEVNRRDAVVGIERDKFLATPGAYFSSCWDSLFCANLWV